MLGTVNWFVRTGSRFFCELVRENSLLNSFKTANQRTMSKFDSDEAVPIWFRVQHHQMRISVVKTWFRDVYTVQHHVCKVQTLSAVIYFTEFWSFKQGLEFENCERIKYDREKSLIKSGEPSSRLMDTWHKKKLHVVTHSVVSVNLQSNI
jgi:hypothetical protein